MNLLKSASGGLKTDWPPYTFDPFHIQECFTI